MPNKLFDFCQGQQFSHLENEEHSFSEIPLKLLYSMILTYPSDQDHEIVCFRIQNKIVISL